VARNPLCGTGHAQGGQRSIINISSISGKVGVVGQTNYSAAKAGIVGLTKAAAKELGHLGVRVNAIQPGLIRTAMTDALPEDVRAQKVAEIPIGRAGEPVEVAKVALFLASDLFELHHRSGAGGNRWSQYVADTPPSTHTKAPTSVGALVWPC
jgi:3-oxoacyl-[acyl-carrier protein] reductase